MTGVYFVYYDWGSRKWYMARGGDDWVIWYARNPSSNDDIPTTGWEEYCSVDDTDQWTTSNLQMTTSGSSCLGSLGGPLLHCCCYLIASDIKRERAREKGRGISHLCVSVCLSVFRGIGPSFWWSLSFIRISVAHQFLCQH
jgi:hypothetical protein